MADKKWIQKATASIKRRGTEGKCTPITKPGCTGRARALALTFKKMARNRKKENGGMIENEDGYAVKLYKNGGIYIKPSKYRYDTGGVSNTSNIPNNAGSASSMIGSGAGMLTGYVDQFTEGSDTGSVASSALKGISAGAVLGPWGMAGGAALGAISGLMSNKAKHKAEAEAELQATRKRNFIRNQNFLANQPQQQSYQPTFPCGGMVKYPDGGSTKKSTSKTTPIKNADSNTVSRYYRNYPKLIKTANATGDKEFGKVLYNFTNTDSVYYTPLLNKLEEYLSDKDINKLSDIEKRNINSITNSIDFPDTNRPDNISEEQVNINNLINKVSRNDVGRLLSEDYDEVKDMNMIQKIGKAYKLKPKNVGYGELYNAIKYLQSEDAKTRYPEGGKISNTKYNTEEDIPTSNFYNKTLPAALPRLKDKAELYYYAQQLNQNLRNKNPKGYDELASSYGWNPEHPLAPKTRVTGADQYVSQGKFTGSLSPEEGQKVLGDKWSRYNELKGKYGKELNLYGENEQDIAPDKLNIGARHAVAFNPSSYTYMYKPESSDAYTNKFEYDMKYDPTNKDNPYVVTKEERYKYDPSTKGYTQYALGGMSDYNAELEQGEPYRTPDGRIHQVSNNAPTHAQGGVQMDLPEGTEILGKMNDPESDKEFKEVGRQLKKAQDRHAKILKDKPTILAKKTSQMMLDKIQNKYDELMNRQEAMKNQNDYYSFANGGELTGQGAYSWNVQDSLYTASAQPTYMMDNNTQAASETSTIPFNPQQDTFTNLNSNNTGNSTWNKIGNIAETAGAYAPIAYNLGKGLFGKSKKINPYDYYNPYENEVKSLMSGRRYDVEPELQANRESMSNYLKALREGAPSQARYMAGIQQAQIARQKADAESYSRKQNMENEYKAQQAQSLANLGSQRAATKLNIENINTEAQAAQNKYLPTALSQLQQAAFVGKQTKMQKLRDKQRLAIAKELYKNYPFDITNLINE
jgi:hypothetical protein